MSEKNESLCQPHPEGGMRHEYTFCSCDRAKLLAESAQLRGENLELRTALKVLNDEIEGNGGHKELTRLLKEKSTYQSLLIEKLKELIQTALTALMLHSNRGETEQVVNQITESLALLPQDEKKENG